MEHLGIMLAFGAAITWGAVYAIDQKILTELSPLTLLFVQYVVTVIVLAPFVFFQGELVQEVRAMDRQILLFMGVSFLLSIVANMLILTSIKMLGASTASIIEITYPLFVVLASVVLYGVFPNAYVLVGGSIILIGAMIVSYYA